MSLLELLDGDPRLDVGARDVIVDLVDHLALLSHERREVLKDFAAVRMSAEREEFPYDCPACGRAP